MRLRLAGILIILVVFTLVLLGGELIYSREFTSVTPHFRRLDPEGKVQSADNYGQLKAQILTLIEQAKTTGNIRLYDYMSDVDAELPKACHEIITGEPLGAFAVDNITFEKTKILSYYDVKVNINYSRPTSEILSLKKAETAAEFESILRDTMLGFEKQKAVLVNYYSEELFNPFEIREKVSFGFPDALYGGAEMKIKFFPENGIHRILLLTFEYSEDKEALQSKRKTANARILEIAESVGDKSAYEKLEYYFGLLSDVKYLDGAEAADAQTPYGVLFNKQGVSLGFAATFKKLCAESGINCIIIKGTYNNKTHYWNMISFDGGWYHIDAANPDGEYFMMKTGEMQNYDWNVMLYALH
ncbi:MAG: hypothetical protein GX541_00120 [Clostridiales bacterium]|jgi:hypothetical protein|nr:hypothetical protein [Clostridiales bacterium]